MITMPIMPAAQERVWHSLFTLCDKLPGGWTLVGGQMVHLHCAERGRKPDRATTDGDTVVDIRADRQISPRGPYGTPTREHPRKTYHFARRVTGRPDLRVHDLRHSVATMAAQASATLAELMARMGHSTPKSALVYQHVAEGHDRIIAERMASPSNYPPKPIGQT